MGKLSEQEARNLLASEGFSDEDVERFINKTFHKQKYSTKQSIKLIGSSLKDDVKKHPMTSTLLLSILLLSLPIAFAGVDWIRSGIMIYNGDVAAQFVLNTEQITGLIISGFGILNIMIFLGLLLFFAHVNRELFLKLKNIVKNKKHPEVVNITKNCELCSHKQSYAVAVLIIGYAYMYVCKEHAKLAKKCGYEVYYNNWIPKTNDE